MPKRITADPPPQPYVDMRRSQILKRVLRKEVLRISFKELGLSGTGSPASVHREFGEAEQSTTTDDTGVTTAEKIDEWTRPGRFVSGEEIVAAGLAKMIDLFSGDVWRQIEKAK